MKSEPSKSLSTKTRNELSVYLCITASYWAFMLTDGALRMLVLLHFHTLGFSPLQLSYLFLVYEALGVTTNLTAGWLGKRLGINRLIAAGLALQIIAISALLFLDSAWSIWMSVLWTMFAQGLSGCAKDLTKTGAKSALKLLLPSGSQSGLFKWVTVLTGSKNAVKGIGFFIGALLLAVFGFKQALLGLIFLLVVAFTGFILARTKELGTPSSSTKFSELFATSSSVNRLSFARLFLFAARDTWFVVSLPVFLYVALTAQLQIETESAFMFSGIFMAIWVIAYGYIQAMTSVWFRQSVNESLGVTKSLNRWSDILALFTVALAILVWGLTLLHNGAASVQSAASSFTSYALIAVVLIGLLLFGAAFAVNSALHSYLILAFTSQSRASMDVGFYYMANAGGRFIGTLFSGLTFQLGGLAASLAVAGFFLCVASLATRRIE